MCAWSFSSSARRTVYAANAVAARGKSLFGTLEDYARMEFKKTRTLKNVFLDNDVNKKKLPSPASVTKVQ